MKYKLTSFEYLFMGILSFFLARKSCLPEGRFWLRQKSLSNFLSRLKVSEKPLLQHKHMLQLNFTLVERKKEKFFSVPCEICHRVPILYLVTYSINIKINMANAQQRGSIYHCCKKRMAANGF